ncbi:hypothetical protein C7S20_00345 [Christiangramia fulva]|uniref:Glycosyl transferase family 1 domain-containing protein n=1 Tax=Christiangramia fulva TaxID=2126553 RepID=A0A2R3Z0S0_9FLAO|nr:glycosyltransferase family 4 protein [Christiangramia fulva]AVR43844.1 hypothetical protein C7S20_00345 [Christiangramia fulva]
MKLNIALCSPNKNAYSETFIQAHKRLLKGTIFYYYDGELPSKLENGLVINSRKKRLLDLFKGHLNLNRFSLPEQALLTSFKKNKIDVVLAEYGTTAMKLLPVCEELELPIIVHFHGFDASRTDLLLQNDHYKKLFDYAKFIVIVSKKMETDLLNMGCPSQKLIYNVYGPGEEFFEVQPQFSKPQFIFAGRFVDKKAPHYLILSFLEVVKSFPDAILIMAGDGVLKESCENLVEYYELEKNIIFPGVVDASMLRKYFIESLAYVQHSVTAKDGDSEGTPVVILEAGAAGLPVISTRHAGIPDVVIDEETGYLVEEEDIRGMSERMLKLLRNPGRAKILGKNARERISSNFRLERHINKLNSLVNKSLEQ